MSDVAELAGVSVATVSGVLAQNPSFSVADETRRRVLAVARELKYVYAKKKGEHEATALPILVLARYGLDNPMAREIIAGIEQELRTVGGRMLFSVLDHGQAADFLAHFPDLPAIRGAIFLSRINAVVAETLAERGIPYILVGSSVKYPDVDMIYSDPVDYADRAAEYLVALGHRRICTFFSRPYYTFEVVGARFEREIERLTGEKPLAVVYDEGESATTALERALTARPRPSAIFGNLYDVSPTLLAGPLAIPDELSVLTMDTPGMVGDRPLSYIGADNVELGREGVGMLLQRLANPERPVRHTLFPVRLHERGSCRSVV